MAAWLDNSRAYLRSLKGGETRKTTPWPDQLPEQSSDGERLASINAALAWLARSQDATIDGGSAAFFGVEDQDWTTSYPETTGYIIVTLIEAIRTLDMDDSEQAMWADRARKMAQWLASIQFPDGGFMGGRVDSGAGPVLFNTGQILSGLLAAGDYLNDQALLDAAQLTADWMSWAQDEEGGWSEFIYDVNSRTYYARAIWPLAEAGRYQPFARHEQYANAARRHADWILSLQSDDGWIDRWSFWEHTGEKPFNSLHTIAYTIEGLLEIGLTLDYEPAINGALKASQSMRERFERDGVLWGDYAEGFRINGRYLCVTGMAQMSRTWGRAYEYAQNPADLAAMRRMNAGLRVVQAGPDSPEGTRGGFPGSVPVHAPYQTNRWINWAAKFALDAFLLEERLSSA